MSATLQTIDPSQFALESSAKVEDFVQLLTRQPQVPVKLAHHFGEGVYIREITMPAGAVVAGFHHRHHHTNVVIRGSLMMYANGQQRLIEGPVTFNWGEGRKIGQILEETVWLNVHAISTDDLDEIEEHLYVKTQYELDLERGINDAEWQMREADRMSFWQLDKGELFCPRGEVMQTPETFRPFVHARKSQIDGKGVFLSKPVNALETIAPIRLNGVWTKTAQFLNHSEIPCAFVVKNDYGDVYLMALRDISNGTLGTKSEEITVDYRQVAQVLWQDG